MAGTTAQAKGAAGPANNQTAAEALINEKQRHRNEVARISAIRRLEHAAAKMQRLNDRLESIEKNGVMGLRQRISRWVAHNVYAGTALLLGGASGAITGGVVGNLAAGASAVAPMALFGAMAGIAGIGLPLSLHLGDWRQRFLASQNKTEKV